MNTRDRLAAVQAAHRLTTPRQCLCGWRDKADWPATKTAHAEHVADALLPVVDAIAAERAAEEAGQVLTDLAQRFRELGQFGAYCVVQQRIDARAAGLTDKDSQR